MTMTFRSFMRKLDGKETQDDKGIDCTPTEARLLDVQGILRVARATGFELQGMEERPEFPDGVVTAWQRGLDLRLALGLHGNYPDDDYWSRLWEIFESGRRYSRSQQQASVSSEPTGDAYGSTPCDYTGEVGYSRPSRYISSVGRTTTASQSRQESTVEILRRIAREYPELFDSTLREAFGTEEGRVQGVCDQREGGEPSEENSS